MKTKHLLFVIVFLMLQSAPKIIFSQAEIADLPPQYQKWLSEDVVYIITATEKNVFLQLETNRERDFFIEVFWKQRDPTPGTPENEFKDEHYQRINYANRTFGRMSSKRGWQTDRGKIYIILGKPFTVESYGALDHNLVPIEVWFYQGKFGLGLPPSFYVVFFKEWGIGRYTLYSPVRHGPRKLLEDYNIDPNYAINVLTSVNPELAKVSRSLIPSETTHLDSRPSISSEVLLHNIAVFPQKKIKDLYAEKLLKYKALIEVDHSANYIENDALVRIVKDKQGFFMVHYAIEPRRLSISNYDSKYSTHLELFGKVSDLEGKTVYQFQKKASLDFNKEQVAEMRTKLLSIQDAFPLIPGNFKFDLLMKNTVSNEFTTLERDITIPMSLSSPELSPLIFAHRAENKTSGDKTYRPFQFGNFQLHPNATKSYISTHNMFVFFRIYGLIRDLQQHGFFEFTIYNENEPVHFVRRDIKDYQNTEDFIELFSLSDFSPGRYVLKVAVLDKNQDQILAEKEDFIVSSVASLPSTWSISNVFPFTHDPSYINILGIQMLNMGDIDKATALLEAAYEKRSVSLEFALGLARAYFLSKKYSKVQKILSRFLSKSKEESGIYHMLGESAFSLKEYDKAIYYYKKYLAHFGAHLEILNSLGECYYKTGNLERALATWEKSLEMDPKQENLKEKTAGLKQH